MPNARIGDYFRVSRSTTNSRPVKRLLEEVSSGDKNSSEKAKRPAFSRHAHLISLACDEYGLTPDCGLSQSTTTKTVPADPVSRRKIPPSRNVKKKPTTTVQPKSVNSPAFERFRYLAESSVSETLPEPLKSAIDVANSSLLSEDLDLTQTEASIPTGLVLPNHLRLLLDIFQCCDSVVSMLHNRKEICSFDKLQPAVQEVVRRNFEETHVGQFLTVYPMVYALRYEKQLDKFTRQPNGNYVLVLSPNLRSDGTQIGHDSPSKGFLPFSGTRLIQRRNRFQRLLIKMVMQAHREFLINDLGIGSTELPSDDSLRRWHPRFRLERAVTSIHPSPLPIKPSDFEHKVTSAKEAVRAFQARALFREADACERIANSTQPNIPSPKKLTKTVKSNDPPPNHSNMSSHASLSEVPSNLKGISQALLNKVRAKENQRRLLTELTHCGVSEARKAIFFRLPTIVTQVWAVLRATNHPVAMATVASRVADVHPSGLSTDRMNDHLEVLLELVPCWLEKLNWTTAHLRLKDPGRPVKDVIDMVKKKVAAEGVNL